MQCLDASQHYRGCSNLNPPGSCSKTEDRHDAAVDGRPVLRFAAVYGFRNIQTLVRKMKSRRCEYDYVEVMACPSGAGSSWNTLLRKTFFSHHAAASASILLVRLLGRALRFWATDVGA